jgi:tRNA dimethylallyltransferase
MDLGSAKPSREERAQIPHHLIDVATPDHPFTAGDYSRQARAVLREIAQRNHLPVVTGGTGLYLTALIQGLTLMPIRQEQTRAALTNGHTKNGPGWLHGMLTELDPESAARIHPNDTPKLIRALEILYATGKPLSIVFAVPKDPLTGFRLLRIGLNPPRKDLYNRINQRAAAMFASGLIEETRALLAQYGRVKALDALGYRQALTAIDGTVTEPEAIAAAQQGHRNYAKRQLTWFRREPDVHWIEDFGDTPQTIQQATALIQTALIPS